MEVGLLSKGGQKLSVVGSKNSTGNEFLLGTTAELIKEGYFRREAVVVRKGSLATAAHYQGEKR